jgi:hypothetical protein
MQRCVNLIENSNVFRRYLKPINPCWLSSLDSRRKERRNRWVLRIILGTPIRPAHRHFLASTTLQDAPVAANGYRVTFIVEVSGFANQLHDFMQSVMPANIAMRPKRAIRLSPWLGAHGKFPE